VDEVLPYGGKKQFLPEWEHDMGLREAIKLSAVPIYQELARRVGQEKMRAWVKKLDYGNGEIGDVVDRFWLDGPLKISAVEQTHFLRRLASGDLPIQKSSLQAVTEITKVEESEGLTLHGKTGWGMSSDPQVGWWVGWIERDGTLVATFALNIDIPEKDAAAKRIPLARACLTELGLFPKLLTR
jgi:beta-lactamase class D